MATVDFILPPPEFNAEARKIARLVLTAFHGNDKPVKKNGPTLFGAACQTIVEPTSIERLERALEKHAGKPGYKSVQAYVDSAKEYPGAELSLTRTAKVIEGLKAALESAPRPVRRREVKRPAAAALTL